MSEDVEWTYRLRFSAGCQLDLSESPSAIDTGVHLSTHGSARPGEDNHYAVVGKGFSSEEDAELAGLRAMNSLLRWALSGDVGIHFGTQPIRDREDLLVSRTEEGTKAIRNTGLGLEVCRAGTTLVEGFPVSMELTVPLQPVVEHLQHSTDLSAQVVLALQLFGQALLVRSRSARFVLIISAMEAAVERPQRPDNELKMIDGLLEQIPRIDAWNSLRGSIKSVKEASIGHVCRTEIEKALGFSDARAFGRLYRVRSALVHSGRIDEPQRFEHDLCEAQRIVRDYLMRRVAGAA